MNRLLFLLITFGAVGKPFARINKEASEPWLSKCNSPLAFDSEKPDLEDMKLDEVLSEGIFYLNMKQRRANHNGSQGATFVFGSPGSGKSVVASLIMGDLGKLSLGKTQSNSSIIYRTAKPFGFKNTKWMVMELLPELFAAQPNNFAKGGFWDCPGFGNSIGSNADIAAVYFLKHALEITQKAKFIFTITHSSLKNESGLRMLATHATTLLKDIGKFKASIGLVVTEVDDGSVRGDEDILLSIKNCLETYIDTERNIIKMGIGNEPDEKEHNQRLRRIDFINGLLQKEVDGSGGQNERLNFVKDLNACGNMTNMSVVWDTGAKLRILVNNLEQSAIGHADFGWILRNETLQEIGQILRAEDKDITKYAVQSTRGIIKGLKRTLLSSQNEFSMMEMINGFHHAFDRHFGQLYGKGHVLEWNGVGRLDPISTDIDFFMTCASQRMKTSQFFQEVIGHAASYVSTSSEPFRIAHVGLNHLSLFYDFFYRTYNALAEYPTQRALQELRKDGIINVHQDNVLNVLANISIEITDQISAIWKHRLGSENKMNLVNLVQKQIPEQRFSCTHRTSSNCKRMDFFGRNVMLTEVIKVYHKFKIQSRCQDASWFGCGWHINVVALEKLYIDQDLTLSSHEKEYSEYISFVAPVWEVIGRGTDENMRVIDCSGYNSTSNGGNAGHFSGVYSNIINSAALLIRLNGGESIGRQGGDAGGLVLINTSGNNITVNAEVCPGSGRWPGNFTDYRHEPTIGITEYNKEYLRHELLDCFSSANSDEFFQSVVANLEPLSALSIVKELEGVERDFYTKSNYINNCPGKMERRLRFLYYERTLSLIKKQLVNASPDDKIALTLTGGFLLGKLMSYRRLDATLNVVSTDDYLAAVEKELEELQKLEYKAAVIKRTEEFKGALNEKVDEAQSIITTMIEPAIKSAKQALKVSQDKLFATLEAFLREAGNIKQQLEEMKDELGFLLPLKHFLSVLNVAGMVMTYLGPAIPGIDVAGKGLMDYSSLGNHFLDEGIGTPPMLLSVQLPDDSDKHYKAMIDEYFKEQKIKKSEEENKRITKVMKGLAITGSSFVGGLLFKEITSNNEHLEKVEMAIETADMQIKGIENLKNKFHSSFVPGLDKISQDIGAVTANLNGTSQSGLLVKKFEILSMLKQMRRQIKGFAGWISKAQNAMLNAGKKVVGVPEVYETMQDSIDNIQEPLEVLLQLYTQIEMYQERKELAQFIADANAPDIGTVAQIKNQDLRDAVGRIELSIKVNLVVEECKKATHAFKQWVFPFPSLYLTAKKDLIGNASTSFDAVVGSCKKEISEYRIHLKKYNSQSTTRDEYVYHYNFTSYAVSSKPFYTWSNEKWQNAISRLLNGESIRLKADVDMIGQDNAKFFKNKAAIKFKSIGISIIAHNKSRQDELNAALNHFRISMDHSGVSLYNVNGQQFVMRDKAQSYRYNYEHNIGQNKVRSKVEGTNSDFLLSPYTWWTFQMSSLTKNGFAELQKFATNVDLVLEGSGTFLDESEAGTAALSELNLSEYYEVYQAGDDDSLTDIPKELLQRRCNQAQLFQKHSSQSTTEKFNQAPFWQNLRSNGKSEQEQRCPREVQTEDKKPEELP